MGLDIILYWNLSKGIPELSILSKGYFAEFENV